MNIWEIAMMLTDPNGALLVDIRESVLVFLPHYTDAMVLLQHLLDLYYGYQKPTGQVPATQMTKNESESGDPKFWIR